MNVLRICSVILVVAVSSFAAAAPEKVIDPETLKDKVTIGIGKKLAVQFEQDGNKLSRPTVVGKVEQTPPTVSFDFLDQNQMLILVTKNPFPKDLKFRALARNKGRKDYFETSIVPVKAGLLSFELWRDPIEELVLFDFQLVGE